MRVIYGFIIVDKYEANSLLMRLF